MRAALIGDYWHQGQVVYLREIVIKASASRRQPPVVTYLTFVGKMVGKPCRPVTSCVAHMLITLYITCKVGLS